MWERERDSTRLTAEWYAISIFWVLLFFPYPPCNSQLQFFLVSSGEEKCHVSLYYEAIMAVSDLLVAIPNASRVALPDKFSVISSNLEAVTVVLSFCFIPHETQKRHVNRSHPKLECFKMETEILTKTMEDLTRKEASDNYFGIMKNKKNWTRNSDFEKGLMAFECNIKNGETKAHILFAL